MSQHRRWGGWLRMRFSARLMPADLSSARRSRRRSLGARVTSAQKRASTIAAGAIPLDEQPELLVGHLIERYVAPSVFCRRRRPAGTPAARGGPLLRFLVELGRERFQLRIGGDHLQILVGDERLHLGRLRESANLHHEL